MNSAKYSKLIASIWFHENKEKDWRINSSKHALVAYQTSAQLIDQNTLSKQKIFFELDIVNTSILNAVLDGYPGK